MRRPHFLRVPKTSPMPSNVVWFDTETRYRVGPDRRQYHHLWFGWACAQRRRDGGDWSRPVWHRFESIDSFWSFIEDRTRPRTQLVLFCHNGAFDLPVVRAFRELPARGWRLVSAVVDAPPMILVWRKGDRSIRFIDTLNLWRLPLDEIGEAMGIGKLPMPAPSDSADRWDRYCRRDVDVIREAVLGWITFLEENDLGGFAPTLASQAMRAYCHRFMDERVLIDADEEALSLARAAYLGGRVECFRLGTYTGEFHLLDVNSMYPAVMREGVFPRALIGVYGRPTRLELRRWLTHRCVVAEVDLDTDEPAYPVVFEGRLCFPTGRFRAVLCGPELEHALRREHICGSTRAAVYHAAPLFRRFVDTIYQLRQEAREAENEVERWRLKILMNSLYGKFGQRGRRYEIIGEDNPDEVRVWSDVDLDDGTVRHYRCFGGVLQEWHDEGEARDSSPAIAAYVASYARRVLWRALCLAGRENVLYVDTDSLVTTPEGLARMSPLMHPTRLGAWADEGTFPRVELHGPKDYVLGDRRRVKGVRRSAQWIADNVVVQDYFVGFKGLLREGSLDAPIVTKVQKRLGREYQKGLVGSDGRVSPFVFDQSSAGPQ